MICKNCNSYNSENSRFCNNCGAALDAGEQQTGNENPVAEQQYSGNQYSRPYNENRYGEPGYSQPYPPMQDEMPLRNTNAIIAIILNVVIFNVLGLVFAVLSLTNYNDYEAAMMSSNYAFAQTYKEKSKRYSKIAIIISIGTAVLAVLAVICWLVFMGFLIFNGDAEEFAVNVQEFENYMSTLPVN